MKQLFLTSFLALLSLCTSAYDFEAGGIYYTIKYDNTVEVTKNGNGEYAGNIVIPNIVRYDSKEYSVTSIGYVAFWGCSGLTAIDIPESVTSIGDKAFYGCSGLTKIDIPASVTSIGASAFHGCNGLTAIDIPASVTSIEAYAFCGCSGLTAIDVPASVTNIEAYAFCGCSGLTAIDIPASVTSIGASAFYGCCGLTAINIPKGVTSIGIEAFRDCSSLTVISIPKGVTSIGIEAFRDCSSLTAIDIPASVTSIGVAAFGGCSGLTAIDIPASVTSIEAYAFEGCSGLTAINIPASVTSIGERAFAYCNDLASIVVASGNSVYDSRNNCNAIINTIDNSLVSGCKNTVIPASVTSIGYSAFYGCEFLADIYCYASTPAHAYYGTFSKNTYSKCTLHVPYGTIDRYKTADGWKEFANIVEFDPTGIEAVSADRKSATERRIYNLGGARMAAPQRGLNIINGKKVVY